MRAPAELLTALRARLSLREQRLLATLATLALALGLWGLVIDPVLSGHARIERSVDKMREDLVVTHGLAERIRELERELGPATDSGENGFSLLSFVDRAAAATLPPNSVESIIPGKRQGRQRPDESTVRLTVEAITLGEAVGLLTLMEKASPRVRVVQLELKRRYQDRARFDAVVTVAATSGT